MAGCGGSDSGDDSSGQGGSAPNDPSGEESSTAPGMPVALQLQTFEDEPVTGEFALAPLQDGAAAGLPTGGFRILTAPASGQVAVSPDGLRFNYRPDLDFHGVDEFVYVADGLTAATVRIDILAVNDEPQVSCPLPARVEVGSLQRYPIEIVDPDSQLRRVELEVDNLPSWLVLDPSDRTLVGAPDKADVGVYRDIVIRATDAEGATGRSALMSIEVTDFDQAFELDLSDLPSTLDARSSARIELLDDSLLLDGVTLSVESTGDYQAAIDGRFLQLDVGNVNEAGEISLTVTAELKDGAKRVFSRDIMITPVTASGRGRTLFGQRDGHRVHLVILGDGYTEAEMPDFLAAAENVVLQMSLDPGMAAHLPVWSIHAITTPSRESGIDYFAAGIERDTVFHAGYGCNGLERLICANQVSMFETALDEYPDVDFVVMLVNDTRYGGSGGSVAIASITAPEILLHELGHLVAGLGDEYVDAAVPELFIYTYGEGLYANISRHDDPELVPWAHWLADKDNFPTAPGQPGVGIFEGAFYQASGFFRPTTDSRMRTYNVPLGPVNSEQWALSVYALQGAVESYAPRTTTQTASANEPLEFEVDVAFGTGVQSIRWFVNERAIYDALDESRIELSLESGEYVVRVEVEDSTGLIRKPPPHKGWFEHEWEVTVR